MKLYKCEMCGKKVLHVDDHHVIPWYLSHDDSESNIMRLCRSCHRKADASFNNLILRGEMNVRKYTGKRVGSRYHKKYMVRKMLYNVKLLKCTFYQDNIQYNIKTGCITITHSWHYRPRRPGIGSSINIHRRSKKAAAVKGQTTLSLN